MNLQSTVREIHWLEWQLRTYEDRYGVLSRDFYAAMENGELADFDDSESQASEDFLKWHGLYKIWLQREEQYRQQLNPQLLFDQLRQIPVIA